LRQRVVLFHYLDANSFHKLHLAGQLQRFYILLSKKKFMDYSKEINIGDVETGTNGSEFVVAYTCVNY